MKRFFLLATWLFLLCGCELQKSSRLRVAFGLWPGYDFLCLAEKKGFFVDEGVEVELVQVMDPGDARRAFELGNVDVFCETNMEYLLSRYARGTDSCAFYVMDESSGSDRILARMESGGKNFRIKGKRVAYVPGSVNHLLLYDYLSKCNLNLKDIVEVRMPQNEMLRAYRERRIDAAATFGGTSVELMKEGAESVYDSSNARGLILDLMCGSAADIRRRGMEYHHLIRALHRAIGFYRSNPKEALAMMAEREGISTLEFESEMKGIRMFDLGEQKAFFHEDGARIALKEGGDLMERMGLIRMNGWNWRSSLNEGVLRGGK